MPNFIVHNFHCQWNLDSIFGRFLQDVFIVMPNSFSVLFLRVKVDDIADIKAISVSRRDGMRQNNNDRQEKEHEEKELKHKN